ncbi:unnamed protein product [Onchocerca flexuosa]|uniref:Ovule protein n=1 Tax=Onchocerca flexuosa TaxID=387005 RepID=A0A183GXV6_9BILA|nr:unnamed protein product [Onchocerca flexuosa]
MSPRKKKCQMIRKHYLKMLDKPIICNDSSNYSSTFSQIYFIFQFLLCASNTKQVNLWMCSFINNFVGYFRVLSIIYRQ